MKQPSQRMLLQPQKKELQVTPPQPPKRELQLLKAVEMRPLLEVVTLLLQRVRNPLLMQQVAVETSQMRKLKMMLKQQRRRGIRRREIRRMGKRRKVEIRRARASSGHQFQKGIQRRNQNARNI